MDFYDYNKAIKSNDEYTLKWAIVKCTDTKAKLRDEIAKIQNEISAIDERERNLHIRHNEVVKTA